MRNAIFSQYCQIKAGQKFRDGMVYLEVQVIGTTSQHYAVRSGLLHPGECLLPFVAHICLEALVFCPRGFDGFCYLGQAGSVTLCLWVRTEPGFEFLVDATWQNIDAVIG